MENIKVKFYIDRKKILDFFKVLKFIFLELL